MYKGIRYLCPQQQLNALVDVFAVIYVVFRDAGEVDARRLNELEPGWQLGEHPFQRGLVDHCNFLDVQVEFDGSLI